MSVFDDSHRISSLHILQSSTHSARRLLWTSLSRKLLFEHAEAWIGQGFKFVYFVLSEVEPLREVALVAIRFGVEQPRDFTRPGGRVTQRLYT